MKKLFLALLLIIIVAGCASQAPHETPPKGESAPQEKSGQISTEPINSEPMSVFQLLNSQTYDTPVKVYGRVQSRAFYDGMISSDVKYELFSGQKLIKVLPSTTPLPESGTRVILVGSLISGSNSSTEPFMTFREYSLELITPENEPLVPGEHQELRSLMACTNFCFDAGYNYWDCKTPDEAPAGAVSAGLCRMSRACVPEEGCNCYCWNQ